MSKLTKWVNPREWFESNRRSFPMDRSDFLSPFYNFQQEFDNLLNNLYQSSLPIKSGEFNRLTLNPSVDIVEDDNNFKVELEMPGVDEKDIKVSIDDNERLIIKASKETSKKDESKEYVMREINYGAYERVIPLPSNVDTDKAESSFKKGMLWVNIPKKPADKSKVRELEVKKAS